MPIASIEADTKQIFRPERQLAERQQRTLKPLHNQRVKGAGVASSSGEPKGGDAHA